MTDFYLLIWVLWDFTREWSGEHLGVDFNKIGL